jgi:hypothetical protein
VSLCSARLHPNCPPFPGSRELQRQSKNHGRRMECQLRLRAFEKLEITHVCCEIARSWAASPRFHEDERLQIQREESELIDKLENFMEEYEIAFEQREGAIMELMNEWLERINDNDGEYLWSGDRNQRVENDSEDLGSTDGSNDCDER